MSPDGSFIDAFPKGPVGELPLAGGTVRSASGGSSLDPSMGVPPDIPFWGVPACMRLQHGSLQRRDLNLSLVCKLLQDKLTLLFGRVFWSLWGLFLCQDWFIVIQIIFRHNFIIDEGKLNRC